MANLTSFSSLQTIFGKLCMPSKIYLVLSVISVFIAIFNNVGFLAILIKLLFVGVWTYILNWICLKGYVNISWALVVLPYVILGLMIIANLNKVKSQEKEEKEEKEEQKKQEQPQQPQQPVQQQLQYYGNQNRQYLAY